MRYRAQTSKSVKRSLKSQIVRTKETHIEEYKNYSSNCHQLELIIQREFLGLAEKSSIRVEPNITF